MYLYALFDFGLFPLSAFITRVCVGTSLKYRGTFVVFSREQVQANKSQFEETYLTEQERNTAPT
jgi:hypothetical protein